jgi:hypothetical protein
MRAARADLAALFGVLTNGTIVTDGHCDLDIAELRAFAGVHDVRSRRGCAALAARAIGRAVR